VRRIFPSLGIFAAGFLLGVAIFTTLRHLETANAQVSVNGVAQVRLDALQTNITLTVNNLVSLGIPFDAYPQVDRPGFDRFAAPLLAGNPAIQALEWIPRGSGWATLVTIMLLTSLVTMYAAQRKRSGQALEASEGRYRSLVGNIPDVTWTADANGKFTYVSPNIERLSGFPIDDIFAQGSRLFFASIHPDDVGKVKEGFRDLFVNGRPFDVEFRVRRKNGEWIWVRDRALTTYERNGLLHADGIVSDITERKRVEESLRVQYETARALAGCNRLEEATPAILKSLCEVLGWDCAILWAVDQQANLLRFTESWHRPALPLNGFEAAERQLTFLPGTGLAGAVWSNRQPVWMPDIRSADGPIKIAAMWGMRTVVTFPVVSGGVVLSVMQLFNREVEHRDEQVMQMLMAIAGQMGPMIDRQQAEDALERSEERGRLLFATIPHAAFVFDLTTYDFLEVNQASVQQYGYSREELLRMKATEIRSPEQIEQFDRYMREKKSSQGHAGQWKHRNRDGRIIDVEIHYQRLEFDGHKACLVIAQDVTERSLLELELRQAQKLEAVGSLAAGIAHEINTPIQFVGDNIRFLSDAFADIASLLAMYRGFRDHAGEGPLAAATMIGEADKAEEALDLPYLLEEIPKAIAQSQDGLTRVATLVRAMKTFAHPDQKEKSVTDINEALLSTLTVARNELKYVADVETELGDLPLVNCNIGEMNQVFLNLLVNAAHAIEQAKDGDQNGGRQKGKGEKGIIRVRTAREDSTVLISISDTGCGIPENIRHKIFDPFFTTKESGKGTGQGLAISRSVVVDCHGGTLTFSTEVGKGTTFYVRLPLKDEAKGKEDREQEERCSKSASAGT
jgi:PAS domain S-box-containing protein